MTFNLIKGLLLLTSVFFLSSCEDEEVLNPRKKPKVGVATTRTYRGSFVSGGTSQPTCPDGAGGVLRTDFTNSAVEFDMPINDTNGSPSSALQDANQNKIIEGIPEVNAQTGDFSVSYTTADPDENFNAGGCDSNGGYSLSTRITLTGAVSGNLFDSTYTIVNICTGGSSSTSVCSGTFSGSESAN